MQNAHDYFYAKNADWQVGPSPVDVPDVFLHLDVEDHDSEDVK